MIARAALLAVTLAGASAGNALAAPAEDALSLGVTTHFGQGWPARYWPLAEATSAATIRETVSWRLAESAAGQIRLTAMNAGHVDRICAARRRVILTLNPRNPLYDGGRFAFSPAARDAFAAFALALADRYPACLAAIELGNEINARDGFDGPAAADRFVACTALLRVLRDRIRPRHPAVALLGGSTNAIATGFLARLFDAGALPLMDGVAIHPYRRDPANLDWEIARLVEAMRRHGRVVPVWATEFSLPAAGAPQAAFLVKTATLLSAAGVRQAGWYALVDQPKFPTMGLYAADGSAKPAALAFDYLNRDLLPRGRAQRVGGDPDLFVYRFGKDRQIVWGAGRSFTVNGPALFRNASGKAIAKPGEVGEEPIVIEGRAVVAAGPQRVLADSLYGFARAPWSYWVQRGAQPPLALKPTDWQWTSYIGSPQLRQASITQNAIAMGGAAAPTRLTIRYTAAVAGPAYAAACFAPQRRDGVATATYRLLRNGRPVGAPATLLSRSVEVAPLTLARGDRVDFTIAYAPGPPATPIAYRLRIVTSRRDAPGC